MCLRAAPEVTNSARPASDWRSNGSSERISRQLAVMLMSSSSLKHFGVQMRQRRQRAQRCRHCPESSPASPALEDRGAQPVDGGEILEVERHQGGGAARLLDGVVGFFQPAHGAGDADHMRPGLAQRDGGGAADAARGAGDQRDAALESGLGHGDGASGDVGEQRKLALRAARRH